MAHENYEKSVRQVYVGLAILAVITLIEVGVSLFGKGHLVEGVDKYRWVLYIVALIIIGLSLYKAKFIIYEFMHMRYEVPGLARSVLLPVLLLVWAIIAFILEGNYWKHKRDRVKSDTQIEVQNDSNHQGMLEYEWKKEDFQ